MGKIFDLALLPGEFVPGVDVEELVLVLKAIPRGDYFSESDISVAMIKCYPEVAESLWLSEPADILLDDARYTKRQHSLKRGHNRLVGRLFRKLVSEGFCEPSLLGGSSPSKTHKRITEKAFFLMLDCISPSVLTEGDMQLPPNVPVI